MKDVHIVTFTCRICDSEQKYSFCAAQDEVVGNDIRDEVTDMYRAQHWKEKHRTCAICGEYIKDEDFDIAYDTNTVLHPDYTDYQKAYGETPLVTRVLHIHKDCGRAAL